MEDDEMVARVRREMREQVEPEAEWQEEVARQLQARCAGETPAVAGRQRSNVLMNLVRLLLPTGLVVRRGREAW